MKRTFSVRAFILWNIALLISNAAAQDSKTLTTDRFGAVAVLRRTATPRATVVLFSPQSGWNSEDARDFLQQNFLVIGVDSPQYLRKVAADGGECSYLAGEIERLGQSVQKTEDLAGYQPVILAGVGQGAALAYAVYLEAPLHFAGAALSGFCPELSLSRSLCAGAALRVSKANSALWRLAESTPSSGEKRCRTLSVTKTPAEKPIVLPPTRRRCSVPVVDLVCGLQSLPDNRHFGDILSQFTVKPLWPEAASDLKELPLVELAAKGNRRDYFAIMYSGDGGWATIDREVSEGLNSRGVSVVGVDSLRYFWTKTDVAVAAKDLARIIGTYRDRWSARKVLLIGFSFGADVIPLLFNKLSETDRSFVSGLVLLSPTLTATLEIHISDWLGITDDEDAIDVRPELEKLQNVLLLCLSGADDDEGLCPLLHSPHWIVKDLPGDHHFGGDFPRVVETIFDFVSAAERKEP